MLCYNDLATLLREEIHHVYKLTIQKKLKDERVNRHLSLTELAEATGISSSTLGRYEKEDCMDMNPFNLAKLAEYKPLAKIEEIEEQNYNMIDGCVNNNPKKPRIIGNRISVLDRLHIKLEERKQESQPQQQQQQERSRKN